MPVYIKRKTTEPGLAGDVLNGFISEETGNSLL
jgi:hypothetical protein